MLRYHLLGPVEVERDGAPVELGPPKQRTVLAVLLLQAGRVVSSDRIADAVWGDDLPPNVAASLQAYISNLRRLLRDDERATSPIVRQAPGYLIDVSSAELDVRTFSACCEDAQRALDASDWAGAAEAAATALALWRGPLVAEHEDEPWVVGPAATLQERRSSAELALVTGLLGSGRLAAALDRSRELVAEQPLSERACWLRMMALYRAGRVAEALDVYREHSSRLDDELGLDTGPALRDLQGAILRQDPELAAWPGPAAHPGTPGVVEPARPQVPVPSPPPAGETVPARDLVGHDRELTIAASVLREARTDGPRWVVFRGEAGIGKTRLAEETANRWRAEGGRVLRTACPDDDGIPPWWPIRSVLRDLGADPEEVLTPPEGSDADAARFAAYDRVMAELVRATAEGPLLLLIEDVHWADQASLRFLTHLAESRLAAPLALLLTSRDGSARVQVGRLLTAVARHDGARQLQIPPLTRDEVAQLAERVSGHRFEAGELAELATRTGGNPFFVSEYARLPAEERSSGSVPAAIRSVLGTRLSVLDPGVLQVLRAAAVIGDVLDIDLLVAVTRLDRDELADLLDEAADEHIITATGDGGGYGFAHALLRDEVLAGTPSLRRQRLHLRVAEALGEEPGGERSSRRAAHLLAALPLADARVAFEACRAAARDAEQRWQSDSAARWWASALEAYDLAGGPADADRDELIIARVAALARAGRGQTVLDVVDAALLEAVRSGRTASAGRLAATLLRTTGSWPWAVFGSDPGPLLARLAGIESLVAADAGAHARVLAALAVGSCYDPDETVPERLSARAIELAESLETEDRADVLADALLGRALTYSGVAARAEESVRHLERLAALPHRLSRMDEVMADGMLSMARLTLGDVAGAAAHVRSGAAGSDLLRLPVSRVQFRWAEGMLAQWSGEDLTRVSELYDSVFAMHQRTELYLSNVRDLAMLTLRWEQGRLDEFARLSEPNPGLEGWTAAVLATARRDDDAPTLVAAELARVEPVTWTVLGRLTTLAHAVADLGMRAEAPALFERLRPYSGHVANIGQVGIVGSVDLALSRLAHLVAEHDLALAHLARAEALARRTGGRGEALRCRLLRAQLTGETDDLPELVAEAQERGLRGVADQARALLTGRERARV